MKTDITISPLPGFPDVSGPHELAWSYLLDHVFADAYHAGLSSLHVHLPTPALKDDAQLRAQLSTRANVPGERGQGIALLGAEGDIPSEACKMYLLEFGTLAPPTLRQRKKVRLDSWQLQSKLSVYSLKAKLWGIPIRLTAMMKRPDLHDRAMFAMRRDFTRRARHAYYQLGIWSRE